MGTIKILGFDEDGNAQRLKIRIARFLDYDPVTASDKSNIRSTLGITSQGGLGDLLAANNLDDVASLDTTKANLEIPDVGTDPSEVPLNQHLGSMAYQDADSVAMATVSISDKVDGTLNVESADGLVASFERTGNAKLKVHSDANGPYFDTETGHNLRIFTNGGEAVRVNGSGLVGIGTSSPGNLLEVAGATPRVEINSTSGSPELLFSDGGVDKFNIQYDTGLDRLRFVKSGIGTRWAIDSSGNFVSFGGGIDFGSGASTTLDDYEEGEHTTTASPSSSGSITLATTYDGLAYTKIGRSIIVTGQLQVSSVSSPTGSSVIFTLPTSTLNLGDFSGGFGAGAAFRDDSSGTWSPISCAAGEGSNQLFAHIDASTVAANDQFRFSICYQSA